MKKKENLRIAYRFLKEMGLFSLWQEYIKSTTKIRYDLDYIDSIFCDESFTSFLEAEKKIGMEDFICNIFLQYIIYVCKLDASKMVTKYEHNVIKREYYAIRNIINNNGYRISKN